jgi:predicted ATPase with chaperone activity
MKRVMIYPAMVLLVFGINLSACSKDEGPKSEKGKIEKMTDHAADVVVEKIRTPIDKARSVQETEEERMRGLDEALKEQ